MTIQQLFESRAFMIVVRVALGAIFFYAGAEKIINPVAFAGDVANYRLLPHVAVNLVAITLPWVEAAVGLLLVAGVWVRPSALIVTVLMLVFLAAIGQAVARGLDINCGCFGTQNARKVGLIVIGEDLLMLLAAAWLAFRAKVERVRPSNFGQESVSISTDSSR